MVQEGQEHLVQEWGQEVLIKAKALLALGISDKIVAGYGLGNGTKQNPELVTNFFLGFGLGPRISDKLFLRVWVSPWPSARALGPGAAAAAAAAAALGTGWGAPVGGNPRPRSWP